MLSLCITYSHNSITLTINPREETHINPFYLPNLLSLIDKMSGLFRVIGFKDLYKNLS